MIAVKRHTIRFGIDFETKRVPHEVMEKKKIPKYNYQPFLTMRVTKSSKLMRRSFQKMTSTPLGKS